MTFYFLPKCLTKEVIEGRHTVVQTCRHTAFTADQGLVHIP